MRTNQKKHDLDAINSDLSAVADRILGLACALSFTNLDDRHSQEDLEAALLGIGELLREEWKRLDKMRPMISECALRLAQK